MKITRSQLVSILICIGLTCLTIIVVYVTTRALVSIPGTDPNLNEEESIVVSQNIVQSDTVVDSGEQPAPAGSTLKLDDITSPEYQAQMHRYATAAFLDYHREQSDYNAGSLFCGPVFHDGKNGISDDNVMGGFAHNYCAGLVFEYTQIGNDVLVIVTDFTSSGAYNLVQGVYRISFENDTAKFAPLRISDVEKKLWAHIEATSLSGSEDMMGRWWFDGMGVAFRGFKPFGAYPCMEEYHFEVLGDALTLVFKSQAKGCRLPDGTQIEIVYPDDIPEDFDQTQIEIWRAMITPKVSDVEIVRQSPEVASLHAEVVEVLRRGDFVKLATYVHPQKGVRFSPYAYVCTEDDDLCDEPDLVFSASQVKNAGTDQTEYLWGHYDGSGFPIKHIFKNYFKEFVYSHDYLQFEDVRYNENIRMNPITKNNVLTVYPGSTVVEYHYPGTPLPGDPPGGGGSDWSSLRLVFEKAGSFWYLVGIVHDNRNI